MLASLTGLLLSLGGDQHVGANLIHLWTLPFLIGTGPIFV